MIYNNKIIRICLLLLMVFCGKTYAEEEIIVRLANETQRLGLFIEPIQHLRSDFPQEYLDTISSLFSFDMNYNGMTEVISEKDKERYKQAKELIGFEVPIDFLKYKQNNIFYVIKMKIEGKNLIAKVISTNASSAKLIEGIALTGDLSKDRKMIHQLSDSIFSMLFQKSGIASSRIIFTVKKKIPGKSPKITSEIFESDYDGANSKQITSEGALCMTPLFVTNETTPKNSALLFVSYKIGQPKIYYASLKDGKTKRLTSLRGNQMTPQASPDGKQIAFSCDAQGSADIFLQTFDTVAGAIGKPIQIYTAKGAAQASPTFSPTGSMIAFVSNKDGSPKIYIMDIPKEGSKTKDLHPRLISKRCRENSAPAWSPDGKKIAYSAKTGSYRQIWIYDLESNSERQLTSGKGDKENPAWAFNSLHLLFNSTEKDISNIYLVNLNQPEAVQITDSKGQMQFPCWKPKT